MKQLLSLDTWVRKDHFEFFSRFEEPFFGVCTEIDCTRAYEQAKAGGHSFFLWYLHRSLAAANAIAPFRYRISEGQVWIYDQVHASPTINRPDGTFGFAYMDYHADFHTFEAAGQQEAYRVRNSTGLVPAISGENVIHYSSLPWINFTAVSHARSFSFKDSCPKIAFGKMTDIHGRKRMPVSVHVHHALMDGYHVGQYLELFQEKMNQ
ncbi:chloramphenicol acetyltransferase [Chitinophaga polysaccharea]|uniref:chloramphenicol acetyltransferase n=1 Tax=Chitinophaga TaxID=79328 RepID=UPI001455CB68|nr:MULTISPECIES: chloramphenicol acetyltransferase [Chitinophaga]NLR62362.1 chloramphenicol acetyltransferase [Chitinophaga polysaccharea]NLU92465.1 chloramphenicol acetyltransferase [Chitinophaga sp. Ak27]